MVSSSSSATKRMLLLLLLLVVVVVVQSWQVESQDSNAVFCLSALSGDFSWMSVFAVETAFTCILALVALSVSSSMGSNLYFGIAIGSCLTLGGFAAARVSGLLNPAVVWSMAISAATIPETTTSSISLLIHCLAFCLFQIAGGILASSLHQLAQDFAFTKTRSF